MTNPAAYELMQRVQRAAEGTPYVVAETEKGFDVQLDVVDAQWFGLINKAGLQRTFIHHVTFPQPGTYAITDESRTVEWVAGAPRIGGSIEVFRGRIIELGAEKVWAFDEHGELGIQADYTFSSEEGRELITDLADQLGLEQRRGTAEKIGLSFAVVALVGAAIVVVLLLVLWATGYFG